MTTMIKNMTPSTTPNIILAVLESTEIHEVKEMNYAEMEVIRNRCESNRSKIKEVVTINQMICEVIVKSWHNEVITHSKQFYFHHLHCRIPLLHRRASLMFLLHKYIHCSCCTEWLYS